MGGGWVGGRFGRLGGLGLECGSSDRRPIHASCRAIHRLTDCPFGRLIDPEMARGGGRGGADGPASISGAPHPPTRAAPRRRCPSRPICQVPPIAAPRPQKGHDHKSAHPTHHKISLPSCTCLLLVVKLHHHLVQVLLARHRPLRHASAPEGWLSRPRLLAARSPRPAPPGARCPLSACEPGSPWLRGSAPAGEPRVAAAGGVGPQHTMGGVRGAIGSIVRVVVWWWF
jgi:hypothetical protein